ncbi:MAG: hypothetical protein IPP49_17460, partial [Saprospiraceae bacterium]|nr:hypothetical protein [Saprospiraceae bacterium]
DGVCDDIPGLYESAKDHPEQYWQHYYFNITDGSAKDSGTADRLISLLRETDVGEVAIPDQDRELFLAGMTATFSRV